MLVHSVAGNTFFIVCFALQCEPFLEPVNTKEFTDYLDYVFHPMDISTLEKNIKKKTYGSTEVSQMKFVF